MVDRRTPEQDEQAARIVAVEFGQQLVYAVGKLGAREVVVILEKTVGIDRMREMRCLR